MTQSNNSTTAEKQKTISIERTFNLPLSTVWEAFSEIWSTSTYKEIVSLKKIVYTDSFADSKGNKVPASEYKMAEEWESEVLVTLEFKEEDGKTNLLLKHECIPEEIYDECITGWQSCINNLEASNKKKSQKLVL